MTVTAFDCGRARRFFALSFSVPFALSLFLRLSASLSVRELEQDLSELKRDHFLIKREKERKREREKERKKERERERERERDLVEVGIDVTLMASPVFKTCKACTLYEV